MLTSVIESKCTVHVVTPAGSPNYLNTNVEVEVTAMDVSGSVVHIHDVDADVVIVQATSVAEGSITISNVPLTNASGNSIKVRYYNSPTEAVILGSTGTYVRAYE